MSRRGDIDLFILVGTGQPMVTPYRNGPLTATTSYADPPVERTGSRRQGRGVYVRSNLRGSIVGA